MTTGFVTRFKGKIKAHLIRLGAGGIIDDASGNSQQLCFTNAGAPTNGVVGTGTLAGFAGIGALLLDITNGVLYQNTGTLASPTWTALTTATGAGTYTGTFNGTIGATTPADAKVTTLEASGLVTEGVAATVTAHSTGGQTSATALTKQFNFISVCAADHDSVKLPASAAGLVIYIFNGAAHIAQVYGAGTDTVDGVLTTTGVPLTGGLRAAYVCFAAGNWVSAQLGVASA